MVDSCRMKGKQERKIGHNEPQAFPRLSIWSLEADSQIPCVSTQIALHFLEYCPLVALTPDGNLIDGVSIFSHDWHLAKQWLEFSQCPSLLLCRQVVSPRSSTSFEPFMTEMECMNKRRNTTLSCGMNWEGVKVRLWRTFACTVTCLANSRKDSPFFEWIILTNPKSCDSPGAGWSNLIGSIRRNLGRSCHDEGCRIAILLSSRWGRKNTPKAGTKMTYTLASRSVRPVAPVASFRQAKLTPTRVAQRRRLVVVASVRLPLEEELALKAAGWHWSCRQRPLKPQRHSVAVFIHSPELPLRGS